MREKKQEGRKGLGTNANESHREGRRNTFTWGQDGTKMYTKKATINAIRRMDAVSNCPFVRRNPGRGNRVNGRPSKSANNRVKYRICSISRPCGELT